jgi:ubiquinone/menaquinone biosynthesis C-methylase UbiE
MMQEISPVVRTKENAKKFYNGFSRWYDTIAGKSEEKYRKMGLDFLGIKPGDHVLEIGFGTGHSLVTLARAAGKEGFVGGIELSDGMAEVTNRRLKIDGVGNHISLCLADGANIPFCRLSFDAIFMSFTLELFDTPEIKKVLIQSKSILKEGGKMVVVSLAKTKAPKIPEQIYEWFHKKFPIHVDCRPINAKIAFQEAGFDISNIKTETMWGLPVMIIEAYK